MRRAVELWASGAVCIALMTALPADVSSGQCVLTDPITLLPADGAAGDDFGFDVRIDGDRAVVGAVGDDGSAADAGSAYLYERIGSTWSQTVELFASDAAPDDAFGHGVDVSSDAVIVGTYRDDDNGDNSGSVYVFRLGGESWNEETKLLASDGAAQDWFGYAVAIDGDLVIVGAPNAAGSQAGAAYVFRYDGSAWSEEAKLLASDGAFGDQFGRSVGVSGDAVIVGAYFHDDNDNDSGAAYVFRYDGESWFEQSELLASDGATNDRFGRKVGISADAAIVGARLDDDNGNNSGSAYVFRFDGSIWTQEAKLLPADGVADDFFGFSVAVDGDTAVIGGYRIDDPVENSGAAYIFRFDGTTWRERKKLLSSAAGEFDRFGYATAISGDTVLVGAYQNDVSGADAGATYIYDAAEPCAETICPDDPNDYLRSFGGQVTGDALDLCASDNVRLEVRQKVPISPLVPFIRLEYWSNATVLGGQIIALEYLVECHVSALVSGGQNPDTLRTAIKNYATGLFELIDSRGTGSFADEAITHVQNDTPGAYLQLGDGEMRVRQDVFSPGDVFAPSWFLKVDLHQVTIFRQ